MLRHAEPCYVMLRYAKSCRNIEYLKECGGAIDVLCTVLGVLGAEDVGDAVDDEQPQRQVPRSEEVLGNAVERLEEVVGAVDCAFHQDVVLADVAGREVAGISE